MNAFDTDVLILKNGGRWHFWASQIDVVGRYVEAHAKELIRVRMAVPSAAPMAADAAARVMIWDGTRGGMRIPHLHFGGEIYALNEAQWVDFSKNAMSVLSKKLVDAQKVSFESVMHVSEAMAGM